MISFTGNYIAVVESIPVKPRSEKWNVEGDKGSSRDACYKEIDGLEDIGYRIKSWNNDPNGYGFSVVLEMKSIEYELSEICKVLEKIKESQG